MATPPSTTSKDPNVQDVGPLTFNVPIVDRGGRPSPEFQRRWDRMRQNDGQIGGSINSVNKIGNFTTSADFNVYFVDTAPSAVTVTMNPNPVINEVVEIFDKTGHAQTHPISFHGGGHNIAGLATVTNYIQINYGHCRLIYNGNQWLMH